MELRFSLDELSRDGAAVDVTRMHPNSGYHGGFWVITLHGSGFEATRYLTRDQAFELNAWLSKSLGEGE